MASLSTPVPSASERLLQVHGMQNF